MRSALIYYPLTSLGPGERIGFWTKGCSKNCKNCMSIELQPYLQEDDFSIDFIMNKILNISSSSIKKITISGGEPFDNLDFLLFLQQLKKHHFDDILVYTGYYLNELVKMGKTEELKLIDVLIDGPYIDDLNNNSVLRGSDNQNIYIFNDKLKVEYNKYLDSERIVNLKIIDDKIICLGIPVKK